MRKMRKSSGSSKRGQARSNASGRRREHTERSEENVSSMESRRSMLGRHTSPVNRRKSSSRSSSRRAA